MSKYTEICVTLALSRLGKQCRIITKTEKVGHPFPSLVTGVTFSLEGGIAYVVSFSDYVLSGRAHFPLEELRFED